MVTETVKVKDNTTPDIDVGCEVPCWLCGSPVQVKYTKKDKPYLTCEACGLQTFVRHSKAEDLLMLIIAKQKGGN